MKKTYSPQEIEQAWYSNWERHAYFSPCGAGNSYSIILPPPNVTGSLHMGHGFQQTLMDALIRYHRMQGDKTLWQPGIDHAGISTQLVVERQLEAQGLARKDMTREQFIQRLWEWKKAYGNEICQQMRRLGSSVDWTRERFTLDESISTAVQKVFLQLYEEGLIYRGKRLVNWDPQLGTALSDLEVLAEEEDSFLWYISYPLLDSDETIVLATTRPETILGDTAVAVHPQDERYKHLIGKYIQLPLCNRIIPIIADATVDIEFGTGCVKITPAHDFNDYEIGKRHSLPVINIFTKKACINENAPLQYQGLDRFSARKQIVHDLKKLNLLVKIEFHKLKIPRGEKSGVIIEPLLTDQWYVKTKLLAAAAIAAVKQGQVRFFPENWTKIYFQWMENIEDWCISRQLWWGHRIPAWYDKNGKIYVGCSEHDVRFKYSLDPMLPLQQDEDVLDTWFSSALWPFTSLGWPDHTPELAQFYPSSVLLTGFDILFFWVARMIMMGLKFTGKVPFSTVIVTGLVRDNAGQKMSKSKGNVIDPIDIIDGISIGKLIEKRTSNLLLTSMRNRIATSTRKEFPNGIMAYGTDALRFTFCSLASTGRNIHFDLARVEGYRNFCNKLWNAARYVLLNTEKQMDFEDGAFQYSPADQWILSRLQTIILQCHHYFANYRFDLLAKALYEFVWHEYCDWYLELSKLVLQDQKALTPIKRSTRYTLIHVLEQILKLLHPIIPFITEEIWQKTRKHTNGGETIMLSKYPLANRGLVNLEIEMEINWLQKIINAIRTLRSEMNIPPAKLISLYFQSAMAPILREKIVKYHAVLTALSQLEEIYFLQKNEPTPIAASIIVNDIEILIPMAGIINKKAELKRLDKELSKLNTIIAQIQSKFNNANFVQKAPAEIVAKEQEKLLQATLTQEKLLQRKKNVDLLED